jgi:hypothetical protein
MKWPCSGPNAPSATAQHQQQAQQCCVQGTYCGGCWRRCACLDAKTRVLVLAVGALASTTCNNFIADLLFLSEVPRPFLVAGPPCVHPYLGKWKWALEVLLRPSSRRPRPPAASPTPGALKRRERAAYCLWRPWPCDWRPWPCDCDHGVTWSHKSQEGGNQEPGRTTQRGAKAGNAKNPGLRLPGAFPAPRPPGLPPFF